MSTEEKLAKYSFQNFKIFSIETGLLLYYNLLVASCGNQI